MTKILPALIALLVSMPVLAQDAPKPEAPKAEAAPAPAAEAVAAEVVKPAEAAKAPALEALPKVEMKLEEKKEEPKPEPKPAAKPAPKAEAAKKAKFKKPETAAEWQFLKEAGNDNDLAEALPQALQLFVRQHVDEPAAVDAKFLEAQLREKYGDYKTALIDYLRVMNENTSSPLALQAKSAFLALGEKKLSRKVRPALAELVVVSDSKDKAERMAVMLEKVSDKLADSIYESAIVEFARFQIRYPDYEDMDAIIWSLAGLHERNDKHAAALLELKKIAAVYQDSELRPKAYAEIGRIYAEGLKDYNKAVGAYQQLVSEYPDDAAALSALESTAKLFAEKLKQYQLAVEIDEKIVKKYPKTPSALKALRMEADLLRNRLSRPGDAVAALKRVPEHAGSAESVDALEDAAQIARKDMKDYKGEIELRKKVASDFATVKDAADQLLEAGEVAESDLKDAPQAAAIYQEVQTKFAGTKPAKKAADRIAKLEKH